MTDIINNKTRYHNANLLNIDGLKNLNYVGGNLTIHTNKNLNNIDGLSNLNSIEGFLLLNFNDSLSNLDGLSNLKYIGDDLTIRSNENLSDCCGIQNLLENQNINIGGEIIIYNNPSECSSQQEVLDAECTTSTITESLEDIKIYPNPATHVVNIAIKSSLDYQSTLYNLEGKMIQTSTNDSEIIIDDIPMGIYILEIKDLSTGSRVFERIVKGR